MEEENKHTSPYTAEDIRRYLAGEMSPEEMYAMEVAAWEDPFLSDAIEGLRSAIDQQGLATYKQHVAELETRLRPSKRGNLFVYWKVAAVVLVVVTGIAVTLLINRKEEKNTAMVTTIPSPDSQVKEQVFIPTPAPNVITDSMTGDAPKATKKQGPTAVMPKRVTIDTASKGEESEQIQDKPTEERVAATKDMAAEAFSRNEVEPPKKADTTSGVPEALSGRAAGVTVSRARKAPQAAPAAELQEVVVMGYGTRKSEGEERKIQTSSSRFAPKGGWPAFHDYFQRNKSLPAPDNGQPEQVSFGLDSAGRPVDIRVIRSISKQHDEEITRMLNEGPAWEILRGKNRRLTLEVYY